MQHSGATLRGTAAATSGTCNPRHSYTAIESSRLVFGSPYALARNRYFYRRRM